MGGLGIIWSIIVGILAGGIAGWIMRGRGFGWIVNLLVGLVGSIVGGWVYGLLGFQTGGVLGILLMSVIGAVVLLFILSFFNKVTK